MVGANLSRAPIVLLAAAGIAVAAAAIAPPSGLTRAGAGFDSSEGMGAPTVTPAPTSSVLGELRTISADNGDQLALIAQSPQSVTAWSVALSPHGTALAIATEVGLKVFETDNWTEMVELAKGSPVYAVAYDASGRWLAGGGYGVVWLWDSETWGLKLSLPAHVGIVRSVTFSSTSQLLATGGADGAVKVWEVESGRLLRTFDDPRGQVTDLSFLPEGRALASAGTDGMVHLFDLETGTSARTIEAHAVNTGRKLGHFHRLKSRPPVSSTQGRLCA